MLEAQKGKVAALVDWQYTTEYDAILDLHLQRR